MTINLKAPELRELKPHIMVAGIGGAGGNAVNNMIVSGLIGVEESGDQLTEDEIVSTCVLLLVAGHETTVNLINNAVDAILEIGPEGDLWVCTGAEAEQLFIEITDSGPGVKDPSRVFDPFYTTKPVGKGTGLGLSICYGIISEHDGRIQVKNTPQRGATFRIELPLRSKVKARPISEVEAPPTPRSGRILVLDANESVLETIAGLLTESSHLVTTSTSLPEARRLVATQEFDLVVADWQMVFHGEEPSSRSDIAQENPGLGLHVLWMSAVPAGEPGPSQLLSLDATVLQKPFQSGELYAAVEAMLLRASTPLLQE